MMSLDPFIRISNRNYVRLSSFKRETMSDSMDDVIDTLLNLRFESMSGNKTVDTQKTGSSIEHRSVSS